jgi:hypothetical protein
MGSGKSTLSAKLKSELPGTTVQLKFADALYAMQEAIRPVAASYGIPFDKKEGRLLQLIGTDWGRTVKGEGIWVNAAMNAAGEALSSGADFVIFDDARFPNEVDAFKSRALTVRLQAPTAVRAARAEAWRPIPHVSETALDDYADWDVQVDTSHFSAKETAQIVLMALRTKGGMK